MKVTMIRKASSKKDWYDRFDELKAMFHRTPETVDAVIEKEIILTDAEFARFEDDLLCENQIVKDNLDLMRVDENNVWHCIAVTAKKVNHRILVESEGYDYARYTAIVTK